MKAINNILFPTDFSKTADAAARNAVALARRLNARLTVLHAQLLYENDVDGLNKLGETPVLDADVREAMDKQLDDLTGNAEVKRVQVRGITAGRAILEYANAHKPDMIVMGTHGRRGFKRWIMGSVAEEVVRFAPCPVVTLKEDWPGSLAEINKILVPIDFSLASKPALKTAHLLADQDDATLEILHVIEPPRYPEVYAWSITDDFYQEAQRKSKELISMLLDEMDGKAPTIVHTITGYPTHEILHTAQSRNADLILTAHLGLTRMAGRPLGSVTEHVVRAASCPVMTAELGEI